MKQYLYYKKNMILSYIYCIDINLVLGFIDNINICLQKTIKIIDLENLLSNVYI